MEKYYKIIIIMMDSNEDTNKIKIAKGLTKLGMCDLKNKNMGWKRPET